MSRKILLADDSVTAQNMGRRILTEAGYEVVTVNNGPAALKKLAEMQPDLVILDIYMPGYGGLEVCQRIKDAPETARLPVLLTVGKLEPFKADEARRVGADAHLVKPFEATELLAALTRLEDRIVPEAAPAAASKTAKNKTASLTPAGKDKKIGDSGAGWKQRLRIPAPDMARTQPAKKTPPPAESVSTAFRTIARTENQEAENSPAAGVVESLEPDITAEEIAAIAAAAAAFGERSAGLEHAPSAVTEEEIAAAASSAHAPMRHASEAVAEYQVEARAEEASAAEMNTASFAMPHDSASPLEYGNLAIEENREAEVSGIERFIAAQRAAAKEPSGENELINAAETYRPTDTLEEAEPSAERFIESPAEQSVERAPEQPVESLLEQSAPRATAVDSEVDAMLAALAPVNGNAVLASPANVDVVEEALAQMGAGWQSYAHGQTRWTAEPIEVPESEASLILEEEMQKAYAALAEWTAAQAENLRIEELAAAYSPSAETEPAIVASQEIAANQEWEHPSAAAMTREAAIGDLAGNDPGDSDLVTNDLVASELVANDYVPVIEMQQPVASMEEPPAGVFVQYAEPESALVAAETEAAPTDSQPQPQMIEAAAAVPDANADINAEPQESAYAAAASAGTEFHAIHHVEAAPLAAEPHSMGSGSAVESTAIESSTLETSAVESTPVASSAAPAITVTPEHEAELAAAWAHWRQIRETVANPQFASQLADAAAAGYKEIHPTAAPSEVPSATGEGSAGIAADSSAIASIVDSVLAELKPKLVAEIARKLGEKK